MEEKQKTKNNNQRIVKNTNNLFKTNKNKPLNEIWADYLPFENR